MITGLMKLDTKDDATYSSYRVACDCHLKEHDLDLLFEIDDMGYAQLILTMNTYKSFHSHYHFFDNLKVIWNRIKTACKILFTGTIETCGDIILDKKGILALEEAIHLGKIDMDKASEEFFEKKDKT